MDRKRIEMISAVIPAYNEAGRIGHTIKAVSNFVDEIIVINDSSLDETALEAERSGARVINHATNKGYIASIKDGFANASGDIVVTIDADGEFPADYIPDLVQPIIDDSADMVQGRRDIVPRPSERLLNYLANKKTLAGDSGTGFRALRTELARKLDLNGACICGIFSLEAISLGARVSEIPIPLQSIKKPRKIAWFHFKQLFYLLPWLIKNYPK
jgi:glycosyltransferase involved in cell wall biosynthesis